MSSDSDRSDPGADENDRRTTSAADPSDAAEIDEELLYEMIVDSASDCFVVVDERNRVVFANPAVEDLFGYEPSEIVGERVTELIPERLRGDRFGAFGSHLRTGERTPDRDYVEFPGLHRDGHEVPLALSVRSFSRGDDSYFVGVVRDNADRIERRERLEAEKAFVESVFDALPDVVYAFDASGQFLRWNERANEVTGYSDEDIEELDPLDVIPERDHGRIVESMNRVLEDGAVETIESALVTKDGTEIPYEFTGAPLYEDGEIIGETGVGRDVSERKRREAMLRRLNDLNTVIRSVDQAVIEASTRRDIETSVCERLVSEGAYVGAVMGRLDRDGEGLAVDASAGVDASGRDSLVPGCDDASRSPAAEAVESRSVQVVADLGESTVERRRRDARERGYEAVAAVPLVREDRVFGVLGVYADRSDAFEERERTILRELGEGIGNAIKGALTHQLLYADTVREIEIRSTDADIAFVALSAGADCRLELTRAFSFGDAVVTYFSVTGTDPETVRDLAADCDGITRVEYLGTNAGNHYFQFVTEQGTMSAELTAHGGRAVAGVADEGVARLTVELPPDVDVRTVVDSIQSAYPETELVARREAERSFQTPFEFRRELAADLTDKQRGALEAAYFSGYFEWPSRNASAEDVAETLDVAPQTLHQHLRVAQEKLLTALFREATDDRLA